MLRTFTNDQQSNVKSRAERFDGARSFADAKGTIWIRATVTYLPQDIFHAFEPAWKS
jgi:hypothetical protein